MKQYGYDSVKTGYLAGLFPGASIMIVKG